METFEIKPGQSIQLTANSIFYKNVYESKVLSVNDDTLEISTPYYRGLYIPLNIGFVLNLKIQTPQGIYKFTTEVVDRSVEEHSLLVKLPYDYVKGEKSKDKSTSYCKFVTVTSGKGGVGKTSFIINYAIMLAKKGKRVVLLDADLGMANIDVLLKVNPRYNLIDVIDGEKTLPEVIIDVADGVKLIPGGSGFQDLANLTSIQFHRITAGFDFLERHFDYILIDTGAGLSKSVTDFIFCSDETIIVTTPEPHAITDAYSIIKVILSKSRDINLKLVVNKCETPAEGKAVLNRICGTVRNFLNCSMDPAGYILESRVVSRSIKEQVPFSITNPNSDAARNIESIVDTELGNLNKSKDVRGISGFVSKFKKLFDKNIK